MTHNTNIVNILHDIKKPNDFILTPHMEESMLECLATRLKEEIISPGIIKNKPSLDSSVASQTQILQLFIQRARALQKPIKVTSLLDFVLQDVKARRLISMLIRITYTQINKLKRAPIQYKRNIARITMRFYKKRIARTKHFLSTYYKSDTLREHQFNSYRYGKIMVNLARTNCFINVSKRTNQVLCNFNAGMAKFYGRGKTSPVCLKSIAILVKEFLEKTNYVFFDIYLQTKISYLYRPILHGLISDRIIIRMLHIRKLFSFYGGHGYHRFPKAKRK